MSKSLHAQEILNEYARTLIRVKAGQLVRRPGFSRSDRPDIEQELRLYLLSRADQFDPQRAALNTFIARVIDSAVAMLVRDRERPTRNPAEEAELQSLADLVPQPEGPPESLARLISHLDLERRTGWASLADADRFEIANDIASIMQSLPPELQAICESLLTRNLCETAMELGLSRRHMEAAMLAIRAHFEKSGLKKT